MTHATNKQMADIMGWTQRKRYLSEWYTNGDETKSRRVDDWYPTTDLNHVALVEARLRELGLQKDYVLFLLDKYPGETLPTESERVFVATDFIDYHWWQITLDAQTRCDAAWVAYQAWKEQH